MKLSDTLASLLWQKKQNIIINYIEIKKKKYVKSLPWGKIGSKYYQCIISLKVSSSTFVTFYSKKPLNFNLILFKFQGELEEGIGKKNPTNISKPPPKQSKALVLADG